VLKSCGRCGKIHDFNFKCNYGRVWKETKHRDLRSRYAWTLKAKEIKEKANFLCEVCRAKGIYKYEGLETHHIVKLDDDESGLLDDYNLICLCTSCHKLADAGGIPLEYLRELARAREENIPPGVEKGRI